MNMPWSTANDVTASSNGYNFPNVAGGGRGFVNPDTVISVSGLGTTRNSASYITYANDHMAVIKSGGTLGDLWVAQKNSATGFANEQDFYKAVLASNPNITDVNHVAAGQTVYLPKKMADGSVTYNYAGGASVNSNATTGEYHMVVPNAEGGQTIYSRTVDGDAGYVVKQVSTNTEGETTLDYAAHQASLDSEIKEFTANTSVYDSNNHLSSQTKTEVFYDDNGEQSRIDTVTDGTGTMRNVYDNEGELFKTEQVSSGANSLAYAVGATASFLSLVKAIQTGKPLPIATTGVNTLVALQSINGHANTVLSGTGAALSTLTSLYSLQQSIKAHDTLGAFTAGAQAMGQTTQRLLTNTFGPDSVVTNIAIAASNDEICRIAA